MYNVCITNSALHVYIDRKYLYNKNVKGEEDKIHIEERERYIARYNNAERGERERIK